VIALFDPIRGGIIRARVGGAVINRNIATIYSDIDEYIRCGSEIHFPGHRGYQRQQDQPRQADYRKS